MSKILSYLKHFFLLDEGETYVVKNYKDYTGPGFTRYKNSPYFIQPGIKVIQPSISKSEVAAYSEMTKLAILIGMAVFFWGYIWAVIFVVNALLDPDLPRLKVIAMIFIPALLITGAILTIIPKAVFLVKNFKALKQ